MTRTRRAATVEVLFATAAPLTRCCPVNTFIDGRRRPVALGGGRCAGQSSRWRDRCPRWRLGFFFVVALVLAPVFAFGPAVSRWPAGLPSWPAASASGRRLSRAKHGCRSSPRSRGWPASQWFRPRRQSTVLLGSEADHGRGPALWRARQPDRWFGLADRRRWRGWRLLVLGARRGQSDGGGAVLLFGVGDVGLRHARRGRPATKNRVDRAGHLHSSRFGI